VISFYDKGYAPRVAPSGVQHCMFLELPPSEVVVSLKTQCHAWVLVDVVTCLTLFDKHALPEVEALVALILLIFCFQLTGWGDDFQVKAFPINRLCIHQVLCDVLDKRMVGSLLFLQTRIGHEVIYNSICNNHIYLCQLVCYMILLESVSR
jgi:hypothetical protein